MGDPDPLVCNSLEKLYSTFSVECWLMIDPAMALWHHHLSLLWFSRNTGVAGLSLADDELLTLIFSDDNQVDPFSEAYSLKEDALFATSYYWNI